MGIDIVHIDKPTSTGSLPKDLFGNQKDDPFNIGSGLAYGTNPIPSPNIFPSLPTATEKPAGTEVQPKLNDKSVIPQEMTEPDEIAKMLPELEINGEKRFKVFEIEHINEDLKSKEKQEQLIRNLKDPELTDGGLNLSLADITPENKETVLKMIKAKRKNGLPRFLYPDKIKDVVQKINAKNQEQFIKNLSDPELKDESLNSALPFILPEKKGLALNVLKEKVHGIPLSEEQIGHIFQLGYRIMTTSCDKENKAYLSFDELSVLQNAGEGTMSEETVKALSDFTERTGVTLHMDKTLPSENISTVEKVINDVKARGLKVPSDIFLTRAVDTALRGYYRQDTKTVVSRYSDKGYDRNLFHEIVHYNDDLLNPDQFPSDKFDDKVQNNSSIRLLISDYATTDTSEFIAETGKLIFSNQIKATYDKNGNIVYSMADGSNNTELDKIMELYKQAGGPEIKPQAAYVKG